MIRTILDATTDETPRQLCMPLGEDEDYEVIARDLWDTIAVQRKLTGLEPLGLAANQIGHLVRVIAINTPSTRLTLVNPIILSSSGREYQEEMCFSLPGVKVQVPRATIVKVKCANHKKKHGILTFHALTARVVQHEVDHLYGLLIDRFVEK